MKKLFNLIVVLFLFITTNTLAQVSGYPFSQSTGAYTAITGGTVVATATANSGAASLDDVIYNLAGGTIPFTFTFDGTGYTGLNISTNGFITFGATAPTTGTYSPLSSTTAYSGCISAFGRDLNSYFAVSGNTGEIRYETVGSSPNREFVIQWTAFRPYSSAATLGLLAHFQIRLHENNSVNVVYNISAPGTVTASTCQVGLRGPNNTFPTNINNRLITSGTHTWSTSVPGTSNSSSSAYSSTLLPVSGRTYTWSPPVALDMGAFALASPLNVGCFGTNQTVTIKVKNYGTATIDFSANNVSVNSSVTGPNPQTFGAIVLNSGTLASNATQDVVITTTYDMSATGTYTFNASTSVTGDGNAGNDAMPSANRTVVAPVSLPQAVNFTGFTGSNLTTLFPNWYEAAGASLPSGTTSAWLSASGWSPANTSAKINLYTTTRQEWIVGPKFTATANTVLKYKIAITGYNVYTAHAQGMQTTDDRVVVKLSTNCGESFFDVFTHDASNTGAITNVLVDQQINLGAYAGSDVIVAFWGTDGPIDDTPDYDFHIDDILIEDAVPMVYSSSAVTQNNTTFTVIGTTNQEVIGIEVVTSGAISPISITKFTVNANGTTSTSDILNAKIYYTGTSSTFSAINPFGSPYGSPTVADFDITGSQTLAAGTNYFWLTFDISGGATDGNVVDAECTLITVASTDYIPTGSPTAGSRTIRGPMSGNYNVGLTPFNKATGKNLYTQRFTRMVERKIFEDAPIESNKQSIDKITTAKNIEEMENSSYRIELVEEEYYVLMENGQPYAGELFARNTSQSSPENIEAVESFATLTDAVANLNLRGVSGWVTFLLKDGAYNTSTSETFPIVINNFAGASSSNTVTIKPATGVSPVITGSTASSVIALNGCNYVMIDGSNTTGGTTKDLTIINTYTGGTFNFAVGLYHDGVNGATNSTIKNCIIKGTPTVTNSYGLFLNAAGGNFHNTSIINNTIKNAKIGMQFVGVSGSITNNGIITNNIIGDAAEPIKQGGVLASYVDNLLIGGNEIYGEASGNLNGFQYGIQLGTGSTNSKIRKNNIHDFYYAGTGGLGCFGILYNCGASANTGTTEISNNFISNIKGDGDQETTSAANMVWLPQGICILTNGTAGIQIYHNSIHMTGATLGSAYNGSSACLGIAGTVGVGCLDIKNNIFRNSMTPVSGPNPLNNETMCVWVASASSNNIFSVIDYNNYHADGNLPNVGHFSTFRSNLLAWQGASGQDVSSKEAAVTFAGAPDLHLFGASIGDVNLLGTYLLADDIDGDTRLGPPAGPYMGADEASLPLPVELSAFTAKVKDRTVILSWDTKTEVNSALFELQRMKADRNEWMNIGIVQAAGNSNSPVNYSFTDNNLQSGKYSYRLKMIDADGSFRFSNAVEAEVELPKDYSISQNYPNPFNPTTRIDYQLPFDSKVTLELYGITGEKIATLISTDLSAGYYTADVNASTLNLASGVYIYRMIANGGNNQTFTQVKKLMLTK